jgi:hypothetical protein
VSKSKSKPKTEEILADPMNDVGEFPAVETHLAWRTGMSPSECKRVLEIVGSWMTWPKDVAARLFRACESPAERNFLLGFWFLSKECIILDTARIRHDEPDLCVTLDSIRLLISPQEELYDSKGKLLARVDFLVLPEGCGKWALAIEIDGHDFHERTKEQAASDRSRDRALLLNGYRTIRFTGAEVYADPGGCVAEALRCAGRLHAEEIDAAKVHAALATISSDEPKQLGSAS